MKPPGPIGRAGAVASGLAALVRRRRENRKPRVRVRIAHGEARVLAEGDPTREQLLSVAAELVTEYRKGTRGTA